MSIQTLVNFYLYALIAILILSFILTLGYWIQLIYYIRWKKPEYWKKLYLEGIFPRGTTFFRFYYGNEDFKDKILRRYKVKFRRFLGLSVILFLLLILSILFPGLFLN